MSAPWRRALLATFVLLLALTGWTPASAQTESRPLVVVLTAGLTWSDADPSRQQHLDVPEGATLAATSRHTAAQVTCRLDGILTLSSGIPVASLSSRAGGACANLDDLTHPTSHQWLTWTEEARAIAPTARIGALGDDLRRSGVSLAAIGDAAALALSSPSRRQNADAAPHDPHGLAIAVSEATRSHTLTVVDAGAVAPDSSVTVSASALHAQPSDGLPHFDTSERVNRRVVLERVNAIRSTVGPHADIIVVDIADTSTVPHLGIYMDTSGPQGLAHSSTARRDGFVTLTDVSRHLRARFLSGGDPISTVPGGSIEELRDHVTQLSLHSDLTRIVQARFYIGFGVATVLLLAAGLLHAIFARPRAPRFRFLLRLAALSLALIAPATWAASHLPAAVFGMDFSTSGAQGSAAAVTARFFLVTTLIATLFGLACETASRIGGGHGHGRATVSVVCAATIELCWACGTVLAGSSDQLNTMFGSVGATATRFYGMNNNKFALALAAMVVIVCYLASRPGKGGVVAGVGVCVLVTVIDGFPLLGADVGGPLALCLAGGCAVLLGRGVKLRWFHLLAAAVVGALFSVACAWCDWWFAPSPSHAGQFFEAVTHGQAWPILRRKFVAMTDTFIGSGLAAGLWVCVLFLATAGIVWLRRSGRWPRRWTRPTDLMGRSFLAAGIGSVAAAATNDSGAIIVALVVSFLASLTIASRTLDAPTSVR